MSLDIRKYPYLSSFSTLGDCPVCQEPLLEGSLPVYAHPAAFGQVVPPSLFNSAVSHPAAILSQSWPIFEGHEFIGASGVRGYHLMHQECSTRLLQGSRKCAICNAQITHIHGVLAPPLPRSLPTLQERMLDAQRFAQGLSAFPWLLNQIGTDHKTYLMRAVSDGNGLLVEALLDLEGIDVNIQSLDGITALMIAAENGHMDILSQLLRVAGINVNARSRSGVTALMWAAQNGHVEVVRQLLRVGGIHINIQLKDGATAVMLAAYNGHAGIIREFLPVRGVNVNSKSEDGFTALTMASQNGHTEAVRELLRFGEINVNIKTQSGDTALSFAAYDRYIEIVRQLVRFSGTDVNARSKDGSTALMIAVEEDDRDLVELLLAAGADLTLLDRQRRSAFSLARSQGVRELLQLESQVQQLRRSDLGQHRGGDGLMAPTKVLGLIAQYLK